MDDSIGRIISTVKKVGKLNNTIIIFTSDNGPSLVRHAQGGCAGLLRCGKATTWEGGMRVPALISWTGMIQPGRVRDLASSLDILPTLLGLLGEDEPEVDTHGFDLSDLLLNNRKSLRNHFLYFPMEHPEETGAMALRYMNYKAHFFTEGNDLSDHDNYDESCRGSATLKKQDPPLLFDLSTDPGERYPLNTTLHPDLDQLLQEMLELKSDLEKKIAWRDSETQTRDRLASPCCSGSPTCEPFPECCNCVKT